MYAPHMKLWPMPVLLGKTKNGSAIQNVFTINLLLLFVIRERVEVIYLHSVKSKKICQKVRKNEHNSEL